MLGFLLFVLVVVFCSQCPLQCVKKKIIEIVDLTTACFKIQDKKAPVNIDLEKKCT